MGRKRINTSIDLRNLIIFHHKKGKSIREISKIVNISKSTIFDIVKRYKEEGRVESRKQKGFPPRLNVIEKRWILKKIRDNPKISAPKLKTELEELYGKCVCVETIRKVIREHDYNGRIQRKKPYISAENKKKRLNFAKEYVCKPESFWNNVLFADESKFNIFGSDGRGRVWRKPNTEFHQKHVKQTVKHGGGSVMVWGCMAASGVGNLVFIDGILNQYKYIELLRENLKSSAEKLNILNTFSFYEDNDPKHTAWNVRQFLLYNCPKVLKTPPQSPDINPIENLWEELDRRIRKHTISSKSQLKNIITTEWEKIDPQCTKKLVLSMPKRLNEVIKVKGNTTKY